MSIADVLAVHRISGSGRCVNTNQTLTTSNLVSGGRLMATHQATTLCNQCQSPIRPSQGKKPVDREWLHQKYIVEGLGCYQIAKLVKRNAKQVWHWLKGYEIPLRERAWPAESSDKPYQFAPWLWTEYFFKGRSATEIAEPFGVTPANIYHFLKKCGIPRRDSSETQSIRSWGSFGPANPMFGKTGAANPNWKGGATPDRQAHYASNEWKKVARLVKKRDNKTCQRCFRMRQPNVQLVIHHIVSFAVAELRCDPSNLILLCRQCHSFVHSAKNVNKEFIVEIEGDFTRVD